MTVNSVDAIEKISDNFMEYAIDTNNNKTFPDVRDGLKPGARACLWEMYKRGYTSDRPHVKCAKVSGGVIASTWPHSSDAIYETFVRMSQDFTENNPEVEFHGNNGNAVLGGDSFANARYTECRLSPMTEEFMLNGVDSHAVDMIWNFSEDEQWPSVLPSVFPRLLVNGTQGIGVSISSFMCGHNLNETVDLIVDYLKSGKYDDSSYMPDFPTGGILVNPQDVGKINKTGRGKIVLESRYEVNDRVIKFTELPFQVYLEPVIDEIKKAIESGKLSGIKRVINASDKNGLCLEVECRPDSSPDDVAANLMAVTSLRKQYNVIQRAIVSKTPELLPTREIVDVYVSHNLECIRRIAECTRGKLNERVHILHGFMKAMSSIDDIVSIVRGSKDQKDSKASLMSTFGFSDIQAKAILDMRLSKLSSLEVNAIKNELDDKQAAVVNLDKLLSSEKEQKKELISRLKSLKRKYGNERRTKIMQKDEIEMIDSSSQRYHIEFDKRLGSVTKQECNDGEYRDFDTLVLLADNGKTFRIKVSDIPKNDYGYQLSLIVLNKVIAINPTNAYFITRDGKIKLSHILQQFAGSTRNKNGMSAIRLGDGDDIIETFVDPDINKTPYVQIVTSMGRVIKFALSEVSEQGKVGSGIKAITLQEGDTVVSSCLSNSSIDVQHRGGSGHKTEY